MSLNYKIHSPYLIITVIMNYPNPVSERIRKTLDTEEKRNKYKISVLKPKSILFENELLQIGIKSSLIYDFYSSKYYLQLSVFFGNKSNKAIK